MTTTLESLDEINLNAWRNGYKWSVNECLRLEREYDLLELSVPEMAVLHNRTINAIMCKLQAEGLDTFNNLYIKTYGQEHFEQEQENFVQHIFVCDDNIFVCDDADAEDEEYVPDLEEDDEEDDEEDYEIYETEPKNIEFSNQSMLFKQVKSIQAQINNLLGYFSSPTKSKATNTEEASCHL